MCVLYSTAPQFLFPADAEQQGGRVDSNKCEFFLEKFSTCSPPPGIQHCEEEREKDRGIHVRAADRTKTVGILQKTHQRAKTKPESPSLYGRTARRHIWRRRGRAGSCAHCFGRDRDAFGLRFITDGTGGLSDRRYNPTAPWSSSKKYEYQLPAKPEQIVRNQTYSILVGGVILAKNG